jgi:hypothetical protein
MLWTMWQQGYFDTKRIDEYHAEIDKKNNIKNIELDKDFVVESLLLSDP